MRRVRYSVAASLDGFIADPRGGYDWIIMDEAIDFAAMYREFDTFIMGRKTWDVTAGSGFIPATDGKDKKEVIVFSRTLRTAPKPGIQVVNTPPADTVRALKQKAGKDIWLFGGGELFRTLADAGLVDTVEIGLMPVLLSEGIPILPPGRQIRGMKLVKCESLPNSGIVMLTYTLPSAA
jgi:dihydrofolate reductase